MIIWINGAFGVGKTTIATELHQKINNSFIFDPEYTGYYLREVLPKSLQEADFQDLDLWREFNYKILSYMVRNHSGPLIVPMTLVNTEYFDSIVGALREDGIKVIHFTLAASRETILERLSKRGEDENSWAARQFNRCTKGLADKRYEQIINTDNLMINEIITKIMDSIKFENEDKDIN